LIRIRLLFPTIRSLVGALAIINSRVGHLVVVCTWCLFACSVNSFANFVYLRFSEEI
jgi:hypothetical protein